MVRTKQIPLNELPPLIRLSYEGDNELWETQHAIPFDNIDDAVGLTCHMIEQMAVEKDLSAYKIIWQKKDVGYFVVFDQFLFSFGVNINFRKKDLLIGWWGWVKKYLKNNVLCILYPHQNRALGFLQKNGMKIIDIDKANNAVILKYIN
jgi:hypothetical protein